MLKGVLIAWARAKKSLKRSGVDECLPFGGWPLLPRCLQPLHQLPRIDLESLGQLENVVQGDVALTALDLADEGPVQTAGVSQCFLALTQLVPTSPDTLTKGSGRR
jgi:hypothetical protein